MATRKAPDAPKFTDEDIRQHTARIRKITDEVQRKKKRGQVVTVVTPEEIGRKLRRVNSPMIIWQGWGGSTTPGGAMTYSVGIYNPDPVQADNVFAHVFIGSGNIDPTVGTFLLNVDPRFPRLTEPPFVGMSIAAGGSTSQTFQIAVPAAAEKTNYIGNTCLMQFNWHDAGTYLDRGVFVFQVL